MQSRRWRRNRPNGENADGNYTSPPADNPSTIAWIKDRAVETASVNVLPTGAVSRNLSGEELAPIGSLAQAGVVAITDDGHCVQNNAIMRQRLTILTTSPIMENILKENRP